VTPALEDFSSRLQDWVGREERAEDRVAARPVEILLATLDRPHTGLCDGAEIPPAWHWLFFHEVVPLSQTGADGHPARGGFLPPVPLPRRMWGGNRMQFHCPLHVGERIVRTSTVHSATLKQGGSGLLCFITVRHEVVGESGLATEEEHDIVYREAARPGAPQPPQVPLPEVSPAWQRELQPSEVLLFRFSALTMNSHRIHYDRRFCVEDEGYPGLLVHGPLTMLLLLDLFHRNAPERQLRSVDARARSPLYDTAPIQLMGLPEPAAGSAELWAAGPGPSLAMTARVTC
jgi:3-methylfumaryl-CoA hydratase